MCVLPFQYTFPSISIKLFTCYLPQRMETMKSMKFSHVGKLLWGSKCRAFKLENLELKMFTVGFQNPKVCIYNGFKYFHYETYSF